MCSKPRGRLQAKRFLCEKVFNKKYLLTGFGRFDKVAIVSTLKHVESLLTTTEAAKMLRVHKNTIYRWIWDRDLPALRLGRVWRYDKGEVLAWTKTLAGRK